MRKVTSEPPCFGVLIFYLLAFKFRKKKGICCADALAALIASLKFVSPNEAAFNGATSIAPGFLISSLDTSVGSNYSFFGKKRKNVTSFLM